MEHNQRAPPKTKRELLKFQPLLAATLRQARRLTRRRNPAPPASTTPSPPATATSSPPATATPRPSTPTPSLFLVFPPPEIRARVYDFVFAGREVQVYYCIIPNMRLNYDAEHKYIMSKLDALKVRHHEVDSDYLSRKWRPQPVGD
jgi:hypothetical protein